MKARVKIKKKPDVVLKKLEKIASKMDGPGTVKVGLPKGSNNYPDGTSIIMVGTVHEFGSPSRNIPQRSYLRSTINGNRKKYLGMLKKLATKITKENMSPLKALNLLGLQVKSDVQSKIRAIKQPPLKSPSKKRIGEGKEGANPLIDTGHLIQSIQYKVEE